MDSNAANLSYIFQGLWGLAYMQVCYTSTSEYPIECFGLQRMANIVCVLFPAHTLSTPTAAY